MAAVRAGHPDPGELSAWCRPEGGENLRRACLNRLKALFRQGLSEPRWVWWLREDRRVLGRLLLVRGDEGAAVALLELPWEGAWRGALRRLLAPALEELAAAGAVLVDLPGEALRGAAPPPAVLGGELALLGFVPGVPRREWRLRRVARAAPGGAPPPDAALDGDAADWPLAGPPDAGGLAEGLSALAARGVRDVVLSWPGEAAPPPSPPGWRVRGDLVHAAWRRRPDL